MIPVTFTLNGVTHQGELSPLHGSGTTTAWHLMSNNLYYGKLYFAHEWRFASVDPELEELADYFGSVVMAAGDSE